MNCERRDLLCSHSNGDIFTREDNMLFSHVKISSFRAKAHLVFHWCLYTNNNSFCGTQLQSIIINHHSFYSRTWTHTDLCYVPEVPSFNNSLVDGVSGIKEM